MRNPEEEARPKTKKAAIKGARFGYRAARDVGAAQGNGRFRPLRRS